MRVVGVAVWVVFVVTAQVAFAEGEVGKPIDVEFKAKVDGSVQRYVEILPKEFDPETEHDLLIGLHGHGSDRWQYIKEKRGECKGARDTAARHGMIFVSPDYRASTSWMGPKAEADTVQLIALLRKKHKVRRLYLNGGPMGATSAQRPGANCMRCSIGSSPRPMPTTRPSTVSTGLLVMVNSPPAT